MKKQRVVGEKGAKALLSHFHPQSSNETVAYFPPKFREALEGASFAEKKLTKALFDPLHWLKSIHYSWLFAHLQTLPQSTASLYFALLPEETQKKGVSLKLPSVSFKMSPFLASFLGQSLKKQLLPKSLLPKGLLETEGLGKLLTMSKKSLVECIDLLGTYDIAIQLKQVVDKALITQTTKALTPAQRAFLPQASRAPMKWIPPKLNLAALLSDPAKLRTVLHKRGLIRFAKGLLQEDEDLIWYVTHKLDKGRGKVLLQVLKEKHDPNLAPFFKEQILALTKERPL